jgi:Tfp pilus assembly protein PilX
MATLVFLRRRLDPLAEDGIALVLALIMLAFFSAATVTAITMTTSTQSTSVGGNASQNALAIAEAGINQTEAKLNYSNTNGTNPSGANLLGCAGATGAADTNGPSNCASPTPLTFCVTAASGCANASAGSASVYGYFAGVNASTYSGITVPASTWLIMSTGYVKKSTGPGTVARSVSALVKIAPLGSGAVAALWNHIFITAPLTANTCQLSFSGNNLNVNVPVYAVGNVCLGTNTITETTQPIDFMVGGKLVLGQGGSVGASAALPITSGVVVGGCTTVAVTSATTPCDNGTFNYWAHTKDAFIPQDAPGLTATQMATDYSTFDPGPKNTCLAGTTPTALADNQLDYSVGATEGSTSPSVTLPNNSGSGAATGSGFTGAFELTPNSSYACISKKGTSTGYLIWNNGASPLTVSNITVPSKTLAINGNVFIDANVTISQALTYSGVGIVENSGTLLFYGNNVRVCPINVSNCASNIACPPNWEGNTGNTSMLTLAPLDLGGATDAVTFGTSGNDNTQVFEGALWTPPSAKVFFSKNNDLVAGPISIGTIDSTGNNATLCPLPVIKNMPTGAPLPPNTSVTISSPVYLK